MTFTLNVSLRNGREEKLLKGIIKQSSPHDNPKEDVPVTLLIKHDLKIISTPLKNWQSYTKFI